MKSGFISVIGRPSAGKSTLINALCGFKVSIVSSSPQTTRNKIRGIVSLVEGQIVLVDTPGFHLSEKKMNLQLNELVLSSLQETDAILYVVDASRLIGEEEKRAIALVKQANLPTLIVINKIDLTEDEGLSMKENMESLLPAFPIATMDALHSRGSQSIEDLSRQLLNLLPEGELLYPQEYVTDQDPEFRISEIIREKAVNRLEQEIPHSLYVEIADLEQHENEMWIRAFLVVERQSQVGIVVGAGGEKINKIRTLAKREIKTLFPDRVVRLDLRVKVNGKWRHNDRLLSKMIH